MAARFEPLSADGIPFASLFSIICTERPCCMGSHMATTADEGMALSLRFFGDAAESAFLREEHDGRDSRM